jgi:NAD(P)-dependent dehydrogenase (short-subunit alcohol dehydrogenase family)
MSFTQDSDGLKIKQLNPAPRESPYTLKSYVLYKAGIEKEMDRQLVVLVGATGNLGGRIARELRQRGAAVRAIVRPGTKADRLRSLHQQEIEIVEANLSAKADVARACEGASCVVSTLLGLAPILIEAQGALLDRCADQLACSFRPVTRRNFR